MITRSREHLKVQVALPGERHCERAADGLQASRRCLHRSMSISPPQGLKMRAAQA